MRTIAALLLMLATYGVGCQSVQPEKPADRVPPDTNYHLACMMQSMGRTDEAKERLKEALNSDGPFVNRADAKKLLAELK